MRRVIITGATSMIGRALVACCLEQGTQVFALVRDAGKADFPASDLLSVCPCPLDRLEDWDLPNARQADAFFHLAWAGTDRTGRANPLVQCPNIGYTLVAVDLAARLRCAAFVGAGSQAEYGLWETDIRPQVRVSPVLAYGVAKYAAGHLCLKLAAERGLCAVWARIFSVYGPHMQSDTLIMECIDALMRKEEPKLTPCEQQWDFLYTRDAARALYLLGQKGKPGQTYNIAFGRTRPLREYVALLRDAIAPGAELAFGALGYPGAVPHLGADISGLVQDTGFAPAYSFAQGIQETIDWARQR